MHQKNTANSVDLAAFLVQHPREHAEHVWKHRKIVLQNCGVCFMFAVNTLRPGLGLPGLQLPPLPGLPPPPGGVGFWMSFIWWMDKLLRFWEKTAKCWDINKVHQLVHWILSINMIYDHL